MKMLHKYSAFLFLIFFFFVSCEVKKETKEEIPQKEIILTNIEMVDEDLNIAYQVPQNWIAMPTSMEEKTVARVDNKFIVYKPKSFYFSSDDNSLLRVGEIKFRNTSSSDSLSIEKYVDLFKKYNNDLEIDNIKLESSNFPIAGMKIIKMNLMSFKFLFKNYNQEIIQFDFSINKKNYSKIYPTIISSINSIKLL